MTVDTGGFLIGQARRVDGVVRQGIGFSANVLNPVSASEVTLIVMSNVDDSLGGNTTGVVKFL